MARKTSQFVSWSATPTFSAFTGTSRSWTLNDFIKNPKHVTVSYNLALGYSYPSGWSGNSNGSVFWNGSGTPVARTPLKWVVNATGQLSVTSGEGWVESLTAIVVLPVQPVSVTATAVSTSAIDVAWSAGSGGTAPTSYKLYHATSSTGPYSLLDSNATSPHTHSGLASGSFHSYYVVAVNANGESGPSLSASATTFPGNPKPVTSIIASPLSSSEIRVDWIPSMDAPMATSYLVRAGLTTESPLPQVAEVNEPTRYYIHTGLDPSTSYDFVVRAKVAGLESVNSTRVTATTKPAELPSTPINPSAAALSSSSILIEWSPGSGGSVATSYKIYHSLTQGGPYGVLATVDDADVNIDGRCSHTHESLVSGSVHYYRISGVNSNGEGNQSFEASAQTPADFPAIPENVVATGISTSTIRISWTPGMGGSPVVYYRVFRGDTATSNFSALTPDTASASFDDDTLTAGVTKYYRVRAFDAEGDSKVSVTVSGSTSSSAVPGQPINVSATLLNPTTVRVSWSQGSGADPTGYKVYRSSSQTGTYNNVGGTVSAPPVDDGGFQAGATRYYYVAALDASLNEYPSVIVPITNPSETPDNTAPTAPSNLQAQVSGLNISLSWGASSDPTVTGEQRTGVAGYYIYRGGNKVGESTGTSWPDPGPLQVNTQYSYYVKARDGAGNLSSQSNTVTPTTGSVTYGWNDGFQSGTITPLWKTNTTTGGSLAVITDPVVGGSAKVCRYIVDRTLDHSTAFRAETLTDLDPTFPQFKKEVWYGWRTLFPAGWVSDPGWCITMQCHARFAPKDRTLNPVLAFYLNGFTIKAVGRSWDGVAADSDTEFQNVVGTIGGNITTGAWTYFVMRIVWNYDNSGTVPGQCQIYVNGTSQMNYTGKFGYNTKNTSGQPVTPEWRFGLYMSKQDSAANIIRTIYNDSARAAHTYQGGSFSAVDPSGDTP